MDRSFIFLYWDEPVWDKTEEETDSEEDKKK